MLAACAQRTGPDGGVCLRLNAWECTLDQSAGMGQVYASIEGRSYLSYWEYGLGAAEGGGIIVPWHEQRTLEPLPPGTTAGFLMCLAHDPFP
jgi:hypothetical protein